MLAAALLNSIDFSRLPQSLDSKLQQTNTKTDENEMPFPL